MTGIEQQFRYDGKRALVVGGATGMGAAAARAAGELGADVTVMDVAPIAPELGKAIHVDLADRASIDAAIGQLDGPIDAIFSAAGVADGPTMMRVNFIGHRHLIESLVDAGVLPRGSAICLISSVAGAGWELNLERVQDFLSTNDFESADEWARDHEPEGFVHYGFAKQAINAYVAAQSYPLMKKGIRINAICPGPTDTPLARANADSWLGFAQDYRDDVGCAVHTPEQMANAMVFLNSQAASAIAGVTVFVDSGHAMSSITGAYAPGKPLMDILMGKVALG
jgi:NAD(P)-dependent dehydrogenase (short-subunit alcohol dehydrogenase family)